MNRPIKDDYITLDIPLRADHEFQLQRYNTAMEKYATYLENKIQRMATAMVNHSKYAAIVMDSLSKSCQDIESSLANEKTPNT